ncbi:hypothetical protein LRA02_20410 [Lentilactobacillus rapi]|uniref:Uncharacterized protein n=1 Tax=Lentilactobacillus rapi TaxID=481723 RepID=A0A512PPP2_9LACO|nr:hypothetical protein LRA02_20410 [Lentilactobacillus rapi]
MTDTIRPGTVADFTPEFKQTAQCTLVWNALRCLLKLPGSAVCRIFHQFKNGTRSGIDKSFAD